jgi:hypothetical protein
LLVLIASPAAFASDCVAPASAGGSGLVPEVSRQDRREIESLLGAQLDRAICGRMRRDGFIRGLVPQSGFLVLTKDEVVFVSDGAVKEVLLREAYHTVSGLDRGAYGPGFDNTLYLSFSIDDARYRFELPCMGDAARFVDELERRTPGAPARGIMPAGFTRPQYTC